MGQCPGLRPDVRRLRCRSRGVALGSCVAVAASLLPELIGRSSGQTTVAEAADAAQPGARPADTTAAGQRGGDRTPVLITHGALDDVVPRRDADASAAELKALGAFSPASADCGVCQRCFALGIGSYRFTCELGRTARSKANSSGRGLVGSCVLRRALDGGGTLAAEAPANPEWHLHHMASCLMPGTSLLRVSACRPANACPRRGQGIGMRTPQPLALLRRLSD